jgi:hypothetical protein
MHIGHVWTTEVLVAPETAPERVWKTEVGVLKKLSLAGLPKLSRLNIAD